MPRRLLITRPEEDSGDLARALAERGWEPVMAPLLSVAFLDDAPLDMDGVSGLLVTSANGLRAFARRHGGRGLAVWAVGDASARAAREAGFQRVESAAGDVEALAGLVRGRVDPAEGVLLHVAGTKLAGDLAGRLEAMGYRYRRAVLYEARTAAALADETVEGIRAGDLAGALFYSPRTGATFVKLATKAGVAESVAGMTAYCLSRAVAATVAMLPWQEVAVADRPEQAALLETIGFPANVAPRR